MNPLITGILLASITIIYQLLVYLLAKRREYKLFKEHPICGTLDWAFIPFNFLVGYAVNINLPLLILLVLIALPANWFAHFHWFKRKTIERRRGFFMYDTKLKRFTPAGIVHLFFQTIETPIIFIFLLFAGKSPATYIACIVLLIFVLASIPAVRKIHGKIPKFEIIWYAFSILAILAKIISLTF